MKKKIISLLLAGILTFSMGTTAFATEDEIAYIQAQKQEAQAGLAQTQANISDLENKKQELDSYLSDLEVQYQELTDSISDLGIQAGEKENQLKKIQKELKNAGKALANQHDAMKTRIKYMYEKGGTSVLETLLSSANLADFINTADQFSSVALYDRKMLNKYEKLQKTIQEKEAQAQEEKESIDNLLAERSAKQQEIQELVDATQADISSYVNQISASQEEAEALISQISSADNDIAFLMQQAEEEAAQEAYAQQDEDTIQEDTQETYSEQDTEESYEEEVPEVEVSEEDSSQASQDAESSEEGQAGSGQGTYLGKFTLTAYCNCAQCCGTAGNLTASGTVPAAGRTVAMAGVPFGTQLLINGNVYTVEDLGTPYGHVDIFFDNHSDALSFGLQTAEVYRLN
ncbi:MAG: hypothetical protein PUI16_00680 [Clostridia bacterium]|nr:hypothetical protein [Clostridia bacterium]MDY5554966.1 hypothetical protein [Blautia sp.]